MTDSITKITFNIWEGETVASSKTNGNLFIKISKYLWKNKFFEVNNTKTLSYLKNTLTFFSYLIFFYLILKIIEKCLLIYLYQRRESKKEGNFELKKISIKKINSLKNSLMQTESTGTNSKILPRIPFGKIDINSPENLKLLKKKKDFYNRKEKSVFVNKFQKSFSRFSEQKFMRKLSEQFFHEVIQKKVKNIESKKFDKTENELYYENGKFKNSFVNITEIGKGSFGNVYKAMHKLEGQYYAIKKISLNINLNEDLRSLKVFREITAMIKLQHPNIVRFITSWVEKEDDDKKNDDHKDFYSNDNSQIEYRNCENKLRNKVDQIKKNFKTNKLNIKNKRLKFKGESDLSKESQTSEEIELIRNPSDSSLSEYSKFKDLKFHNKNKKNENIFFNNKEPRNNLSRNLFSEDRIEEDDFEIIFEKSVQKPKNQNLIKNKHLRRNPGKIKVTLYIQMELCSGKSLNNYVLLPEKKIEEKLVFYIFSQVLEGLIYIHSKGVVHRDLKPGNIFVQKGEIKIGDFGLAKIIDKEKLLQSCNKLDSNFEFSCQDLENEKKHYFSNFKKDASLEILNKLNSEIEIQKIISIDEIKEDIIDFGCCKNFSNIIQNTNSIQKMNFLKKNQKLKKKERKNNTMFEKNLKNPNIENIDKNSSNKRIKFYKLEVNVKNQPLENNPITSNFKFSKKKISNSNYSISEFSSNIGTPLYNSPEQLNTSNYDYKSDIFSLGIILFELLSNFSTFSEKIQDIKYVSTYFKVPSHFVTKFPEVSELINLLVQPDPFYRISTFNIKNNDYFVAWKNKVEKITFF